MAGVWRVSLEWELGGKAWVSWSVVLPVLGNHWVENPILIRDQNGILRGILRGCSTRFSFKVNSISNSRRAVLYALYNTRCYTLLNKKFQKVPWQCIFSNYFWLYGARMYGTGIGALYTAYIMPGTTSQRCTVYCTIILYTTQYYTIKRGIKSTRLQ